jgi:hypothetical protein
VLAQHAIDFGQSMPIDVRCALPGKISFQPRSQLSVDHFLRPPPHFPADIPPVDSHVVAVAIDAADHDVDVRVVGVVVIHRRPNEAPSGVFLHPLHELPSEFFEIQSVTILRRNDESKLSLLAIQRRPKFIAGERFVSSIKPSAEPSRSTPSRSK